jgi:phosphoenolpyruvate carboxykinase (GTP)
MDNDVSAPVRVTNQRLLAWVRQMRRLCQPDSVHWVDGSVEEYDRLCAQLVQCGTLVRLNPEKRPNSYLARSHPSDVGRVEERTFVCSLSKDDAGPTNNWAPPGEMRAGRSKSRRRFLSSTFAAMALSGWACRAMSRGFCRKFA